MFEIGAVGSSIVIDGDGVRCKFPRSLVSSEKAIGRKVNMHFTYEGFTQDGDSRCFLFRGIEERDSTGIFSIEIDLRLLAQNQVLIQEGPMFCLRLLAAAEVSGPDCLARFHPYRVVGEDFRPLHIEREGRAAEKALKKKPRRPFRKPPPTANLWLGRSSEEH
jgi:hypothetical protein